ncbi:MAG: methyltransferase domain-containing protein [Anaerolineae bacterium]
MSTHRHDPRRLVLSFIQAEQLLAMRQEGKDRGRVSPDLGLSEVWVTLDEEGVDFGDQLRVTWEELERIRSQETGCFRVTPKGVEKIQVFSELTNRVYTLMPTRGAPTMLISGIPMHRIKEIEPHEDTLRKIRAISPIVGRVLDTATGLGYTAIEASRAADEVVTIELDPAALEIARENPWSRLLFEAPNIRQLIGDSCEIVRELETASFDRIIHDPPMMSLAGEMYSGELYRELYRVLKPGGRLLHYIGDLESKSSGNIARGVAKRLEAAGFRRVVRRPEAFSLVAYK